MKYNHYTRLVKRPIRHDLLLTEPDYLEATKIMYMAACIMTGTEYIKADGYEEYAGKKVNNKALLPLKYLRKADPMAYAYLIKTDNLLDNVKIIL